jgi:hypothetical protein
MIAWWRTVASQRHPCCPRQSAVEVFTGLHTGETTGGVFGRSATYLRPGEMPDEFAAKLRRLVLTSRGLKVIPRVSEFVEKFDYCNPCQRRVLRIAASGEIWVTKTVACCCSWEEEARGGMLNVREWGAGVTCVPC